jgi:hypothetical protein
VRDNRQKICQQVEAAIDKYKLGLDEVGYEVGFGWGPSGPPQPGMPQQLIMAYWIVISIKSPLLGQPPLNHVLVMPDFQPTQKAMDDLIMQGLGQLRDMKAKVMSVGNGQELKRG